VRERKLSAKDHLRVQTRKGVIEPHLAPDGGVTVNMGVPVFLLDQVPFDSAGMVLLPQGDWGTWSLPLQNGQGVARLDQAVL
jgi:diaminopimelate epimerase